MSRLSFVATPYMLCVLSVSCRVYDAELIRELAVRAGNPASTINAATAMLDASVADAALTEAAPVIVPACGNGRLDGRERCDIAIAAGEVGACPDGCPEQDGCFAQELAGQRCGARCVPKEITESIAGDGCCPKGATAATDSDCSATCGNGVIEAAETCDPMETCPSPGSCTTAKKCMAARLTGAAETCSARCQVQPITACESGDDCCPSGCSAEVDRDCPVGGVAMQGESNGTSTEAGTAPADPNPTCMDGQPCGDDKGAQECATVHSGGPCHSCDCAYCAANVAQCQAITADTSSCARLGECALQNHCQGLQCLCGDAAWNACANRPTGPCVYEVRDVAGARDYYSIVWEANTPGSALATALSLLQCRADHCAETCGL